MSDWWPRDSVGESAPVYHDDAADGEPRRGSSPELPVVAVAKRQGVILLVALVALLALFGRTAWWQVAQGSTLATRAQSVRERSQIIPAARGAILDVNGVPLAVSVTYYSVVTDPLILRSQNALDQAARDLSAPLGLPAATILSQIDVPGEYAPLHDASGRQLLLSDQQSAAAQSVIARDDLSAGVALEPVVVREYPQGTLAAQELGFVRQSDGVGQYGVEQLANATLGGKPGLLYTAIGPDGRPQGLPLRETDPTPGANVTLTLDANVQAWAQQGLASAVTSTRAEGGEVIVMDPSTGAIIAMASATSFDPNHYYNTPSLNDFANPAVSSVYDPGSVMKAVTMSAGIEQGAISPDTTFYDPGYADVAGVRIWNFGHQAHGRENMTQTLQYSANVGAIFVARHVGVQRFNQTLDAFGFGQLTGSGLPGEVPGLRGGAGESAELTLAENAFGESIGVTPLQVAQAYAALANGGALMRPHIIASVTEDGGLGPATTYAPVMERQVVSGQTAATVTSMLTQSALNSDAHMRLLPGYAIAAKTGTSTPNPNDPSWTYASVVGYAPATHPRFVLLVKLDHPRTDIFGGGAAGPLWRELALRLFQYYRIPPTAATP